MLLRLVTPVKRSGSSNIQLKKRIPLDVLPLVRGQQLAIPIGGEWASVTITDSMNTIRLSLRTADLSVAKVRQAEALAHLERVFESYRADRPVELSQRNAVALSRVIYEGWAEGEARETTVALEHTEDGWKLAEGDTTADEGEGFAAVMGQLAALEGDGAEAFESLLGPVVDHQLAKLGVSRLTAASRERVLEAFRSALYQGLAQRKRNAEGDFTPDPRASRFPPLEVGHQVSGTKSSRQTITGLAEAWWEEARAAGRSQSTYEAYARAAKQLATFLRRDDARTVTTQNIMDFTAHRRDQGASAKTINQGDLSALNVLFDWGRRRGRVPANPVDLQNSKVIAPNPSKSTGRRKSYSDEEALAVLNHASKHRSNRERAQLVLAKQWVPWLCAYTGARLGEMAQLRGTDVFQQAGRWVLRITPEGTVTVKTGTARTVPLHPHLVDMGFPQLAQAAGKDFMFLAPRDDTEAALRGAWRTLKNRITTFIREVVTDRRLQPSHAWRHRMETKARTLGWREDVTNSITGHVTPGVAATYGDMEILAMSRALDQLPRYEAEEPPAPK
ncbi:phage integrase N-terminal SAM-like domain-containing protein [Pelagibacterium sp.]|uniref:phage integrase N-terminal SAM-like domain-containing protein n=1 Tax=Pelagibacterium sp. TaxID=1967288 RepID=UPI003BAD7A58